MLQIGLIGPGDTDFHFNKLLKISLENYKKEITKIANSLFETNSTIRLTPDKGVSFDIAKIFKENGGEIIALAPLSDKNPGTNHLKKYIEAKTTKNENLFNEIINTGDWANHDIKIGLFSDILLYLGESPGTLGELSYAIYMQKIINNLKKNINEPIQSIHKDAIATTKIPYTILIYTPFLKNNKISYELENYAKKYNTNMIYINNPEELTNTINNLKNQIKEIQ